MHIIAGKFKKKALLSPKSAEVRPTMSNVREAVFNITQAMMENARFLDVCAGSGAMGLEALSRGAQEVTFIEKSRSALSVIHKNIALLGVEHHSRVMSCDALKGLENLVREGQVFDLIYVDPPYGQGLGTKVLQFLDTHPLLSEEGSLFIEESRLVQPKLQSLELKREKKVGRAHLFEYRSLSKDGRVNS